MAFKNLREDNEKQERLTKHHQTKERVKKDITEENAIRAPHEKVKRADTGKWVKNFEDYMNEDDDLDIE